MNSGCFESEFKDILISVQCIDFDGTLKMINKKISSLSIETNLSKDLIFLSATLKKKIKQRNCTIYGANEK